jgi:hypothetical protein
MLRGVIVDVLAGCASGRDLADGGHRRVVELAGEAGESTVVRVLADGVLEESQ